MPALRKSKPQKMTVDEFIEWREGQEGRWELHDGVPVRLHDPARGQSERFGHLRAKFEAAIALREAVRQKKLDCEVVPDGATVRIDEKICYEPDALVYCGQKAGRDETEAPDPVIIVEVLSPSTAWKDVSAKLEDYFKLPSLAHYLVIDPNNQRIIHHYRHKGQIAQCAVLENELNLDPPGIVLKTSDIFNP